MEATHYYYGLSSRPRLIARSSLDVWVVCARLMPKNLSPLGPHRLNSPLWEGIIGPAMDRYLQEKGIPSFSMVPLRIGFVDQPSPPAVIFIGVSPGTLSAELGREVAIHCRSILLENDIDDIHVEIRESERIRCASLYPPATRNWTGDLESDNRISNLKEPFSTSIGLPICNANTPYLEGTSGFFFTDRFNPGPLQMVTVKHALFDLKTEHNTAYTSIDGSPRNVMLLGDKAFDDSLEDLGSEIDVYNDTISCRKILKQNKLLGKNDAEASSWIEKDQETLAVLESLHNNVKSNWTNKDDRVIGHLVLSPPLTLGYGEEGYSEDWAVVEIRPTKINRSNFVGNVIDVGSVGPSQLIKWMCGSFRYPLDSLLRCSGVVSDQKIYSPDGTTLGHNQEPALMVIKNGSHSGVTVGCLNNIRAFSREFEVDQKISEANITGISKEIVVFPHPTSSTPFSTGGDSGSLVVDGTGRACGILVAGDGKENQFDMTYVTSINFILKRLAEHGIDADINFPTPARLSQGGLESASFSLPLGLFILIIPFFFYLYWH